MAFTQADVDALDAAFKTGAESVRLADGRSVTYRSLEEYRALRAQMVAAIVALETGVLLPRTIAPSVSKGIR